MERRQLEGEVHEERTRREVTQKQLEAAEQEKAALERALHEAEGRLQQATAAEQSASLRLSQSQSELDVSTRQLRESSHQLDRVEEEVRALQRQASTLQGDLGDAKREQGKAELACQLAEQDLQSQGQRHGEELANQLSRFEALRGSLGQVELERDGLQDQLAALRGKLELQTCEIETAGHANQKLQGEVDRARAQEERASILNTQLEADRDGLLREGANLKAELLDACGERDRFAAELARLRSEVEQVRTRHASELENERSKFSMVEERAGKSESARAELEAKLLEMRRAIQELEQRLGAELREGKVALGRAEGERRQDELEMARLKREISDLQNRLGQLQREKAALDEDARQWALEKNTIIEDGKKRRVRSGMHLASLIWEKNTALHFACSYYLWAQVASEGAMARGAAELNKITANVMDRERAVSYDGFDYDVGAIDVAAVSREFGL